MPHLSARVVPRVALSDANAHAMYALFERYYDGVSPAQFRADLAGKSHVIELREGDELRGFSTIALIDFHCGGVARRAIFSDDTIIDHRCWGEQALPLAFCEFAGAVHAADVARPLYWFLISKGYRTYRYLGLFSREYYPSVHAATTAEAQACMDTLARARFGEHYDAARGVLHFPVSRGHLKSEWAQMREAVRERPDVRFFLERNPGYASGDELVCLTRLVPENLRSYARRAFAKGMAQGRVDIGIAGNCDNYSGSLARSLTRRYAPPSPMAPIGRGFDLAPLPVGEGKG